MRLVLAITTGKIIAFIVRFLNIGGGSAAPGLYALKVCPDLVSKLSSQIPKNVIITGTNGKTTTARIVSHFSKASNIKFIRNSTGSNLERGIASSLISSSTLLGRLPDFDLGVWELDEYAFNLVAPKIKPQAVVFLNIFRDQLDRYGEIDNVLKRWCQTLESLSSQSTIILNGDDNNIMKLRDCFGGEVKTFGLKGFKLIGESLEHKKQNRKLDFEATKIKLNGLNNTFFDIALNHKQFTVNLPLPGVYHIYDAVAAMVCAQSLGMQAEKIAVSLTSYQPAFGRVERLNLSRLTSDKASSGYILLIKNPAGATQVFETIAPQIKKEDRLLIALNDNFADGTDVSWIWDANFEILQNSFRVKSGNFQIVSSGTRAQDLAVRLKYAGFDPESITVQNDLKQALSLAKKELKGDLFILPTYTAMLELQKILTRSGLKKHYWIES